jgi:hypothetical protein
MPELLRSRLMTPPAETPKPDQDAGLIAATTILGEIETDLRGHGNRIYRGEPRAATEFFRRANAIQDVLAAFALRDRQIAGLVEGLELIRHVSTWNSSMAQCAWHAEKVAEAALTRHRAVRSLETEGET